MGEEFLAVLPSDRAVEQAILALKKGAHILKYGRRGKPKFCPFRLSTDEKILIWYSDQEEKQLQLSSVTNIVRGRRTKRIQPERDCQSFSIIYANGESSLDLICKDKTQADSWFLGLKVVISRCHHPRAMGNSEIRGAQSCISSPASFMRRKRNLGLLEETPKLSKVHSLSGSPAQSFSERCFSDGLSCSSDSFYSQSSLSSMQNIMDILAPNSPHIEPEDHKREAVCTSSNNHTKMLSRFAAPAQELPKIQKNVLRDVFMWGGEFEGGILEGRVDKIGYHNGQQSNALLPKLLESTTMLDVQKVSLGGKHAALVTKLGEVFCWGEGKGGRLGHNVNMDIGCPKEVDSLNGVHVKSIYCGEYQTCALTLSGELYTWGDSYYGSDRNRSQWMPRRFSGLLDGVSISSVACGEWHMAIVTTSGRLFTYGDGTFGVLGHGNLETIFQPKEVESLKGLCVKSVACGPWHTAAIVGIMGDECESSDPTGKLFTWGDGDKGRLGHSDQKRKLAPTCIEQLVNHDFVQVSCGRMLTVGLTCMGVVYTMGSSVHGQLGNPQSPNKSITIVQGKLKFEFIKEIASGSYHTAALTSRGNVYTWGKGASGQLGLGDTEDRDSPTLVEALRERQVESIACGSTSTAAICLHKSFSSTDQSACRGCNMAFGFMRKKHNCYHCGLVFCRTCTSKKINSACLAPNNDKPFRVCDPCFNHLERSTHSARLLKMDNQSPRPLLITHKASSDHNKDGAAATPKRSAMMLSRNYCDNDSQWANKNQGENKQPSDLNSSLLGGLPRWGQVSSPESFRRDVRDTMTYNPVCSQDNPQQSKSSASTFVNVRRDFSQSDKNVREEVEKLRAKAESLEKLCHTREHEIQGLQRRVDETWSLAKEEAAKCKAAKDVIKALTSRLHIMSQKTSVGKEVKDQVDPKLPLLKIKCSDRESPTVKSVRSMISTATKVPPEVGQLEERKVDCVFDSPILFSSKLRNLRNRNILRGDTELVEEPCMRRTDSGQNEEKAKCEWIEQHQPGVYITFTTSSSGQKGLKRVRFSRKRFTAKEAESWWAQNQVEVYQKYDIDGFINTNHGIVKV